jgi:hypothetical protein
MKKLPGQSQMTIRIRLTCETPVTTATKREIGPISMGFEIPMYNVRTPPPCTSSYPLHLLADMLT